VTIYDPQTTRPNPNGTGFVRDPFPGNIIPNDRISPISRYFQSFLPAPTGGGVQNNYLGGALPTGFNNDNVTAKVDLPVEPTAATLGAVLARQAQSGDALPRRHQPANGSALPYTETRLVEEAPTSAQVKHTYVLGPTWVNQVSLGFSRLSVPIFNATIDGQYPIKAGLKGLPAGEADSSFPEVSFAGPNAPTMWRGTDARAFTEYLNNYTLQDNLNWTRGKHAMTFGFQGQRMDANERERTYGSLATFGFSNVQTAGFSSTGTLMTATGNAYASFLLGELNATNVIEGLAGCDQRTVLHLRILGAGRFQAESNLTLNLGLRYDIMKPYTEVYDRWSFLDPTLPNPAVGGYPGALVFAGDGVNSCHCRTPINTYYGALGPAARPGLQLQRTPGGCGRVRHQLFPARRRRRARGSAQWHRDARPLRQRQLPERERVRSVVQLEQRSPVVSGAALLRSDAERRLRRRPRNGWRRHLRRSGHRRTAASLSELERRRSVRAGTNLTSARHTRAAAAISSAGSGRGVYSNQLDPRYLVLGNAADPAGDAGQHRRGAGDRAGVGLPYPNFSGTIAQMLRPFPQYSG
jgi:hypothetical protein